MVADSFIGWFLITAATYSFLIWLLLKTAAADEKKRRDAIWGDRRY